MGFIHITCHSFVNLSRTTLFVVFVLESHLTFGTTGVRSEERRSQLLNEVPNINQGIQDPRLRLGLRSDNTHDKGQFLNVAGTTVHIDDRLGCLDSCEDSIHTYWVTSRARYHRRHHILAPLREAPDHAASDRSIQATLQLRQFGSHWQILF